VLPPLTSRAGWGGVAGRAASWSRSGVEETPASMMGQTRISSRHICSGPLVFSGGSEALLGSPSPRLALEGAGVAGL